MLRKALPGDIDFIYELYMHPAVNPYLLYEPMDKRSFQPIYDELIQKGVKYVYEEENTRAGMVKLIPYTYRAAHVAYVGGLAIHPDLSGKGHGRKLMEDLLDLARQNGFKRLELSASVTNDKAIRLYEQVGFKKEGILEKYNYLAQYDDYFDEVLMAYLFDINR